MVGESVSIGESLGVAELLRERAPLELVRSSVIAVTVGVAGLTDKLGFASLSVPGVGGTSASSIEEMDGVGGALLALLRLLREPRFEGVLWGCSSGSNPNSAVSAILSGFSVQTDMNCIKNSRSYLKQIIINFLYTLHCQIETR